MSSKDQNFDEIINAKIGSESQDARRRDRKIKFKAFVKDCDNKRKDSDFDPEGDFNILKIGESHLKGNKKKGVPEPVLPKRKRRVAKIPIHHDEDDLLADDEDEIPKKKKGKGRPKTKKKHDSENELEADESDIDKQTLTEV